MPVGTEINHGGQREEGVARRTQAHGEHVMRPDARLMKPISTVAPTIAE